MHCNWFLVQSRISDGIIMRHLMCQSLYLNYNFNEIMKHLYRHIVIKQKLELKREEKLFFLYFVLLYLNRLSTRPIGLLDAIGLVFLISPCSAIHDS